MQTATKGNRLHIGIFGKMNVGKSSLMNAILSQKYSIVSEVAGTTTDYNEKAMEILPLGPVLLIDTAGIDDKSVLGQQRIEKSREIIERTDVALVVIDERGINDFDIELFNSLKSKNTPIIAVINKTDIKEPTQETLETIKTLTNSIVNVSTTDVETCRNLIRKELIKIAPEEFINPKSLVDGIIEENGMALLVTPIDKEAPKGRLILPQVQTLRELLDRNCQIMVVKEDKVKEALNNLKQTPDIVITDSQAFKIVSEQVPQEIPLTSFSILFARQKGDLKSFVEGAKAIDTLKNKSRVLICESCTHHSIEDDIGTVKIPNLIRKRTGVNPIFEKYSSHEFPKNIEEYELIVHCGGCMTNRREILSRIEISKSKNVPITNYGISIAYCLNILERATKIFKN